jgi:cobalt-zinc-cadmium resistance protein CzcA
VRLPERHATDAETVRRIPIALPGGGQVPLERLADVRQIDSPATITREWQRRRIVVQCNVRDRDMGGFVTEARERIAATVALPEGYYTVFAGQFENLERARLRLMLIVPLALLLIFFLLYQSTQSLRDALLILTGAPLAALGGILALWVRGMPFTVSAGIGFVAVSGVAMLGGLVLVSTLRRALDAGVPMAEAVEDSALLRLRPVLMTTLVASLGFVPMALNTGVGAEVQRPLATVVIGGVLSANFLTLLVLPALYRLVGARGSRRGKDGIAETATLPG